MGTRFDAHTAMELSIGDAVIEFCVDLNCMLHKGRRKSFDEPGEPDSVEVMSVGQMWEEQLEVVDGELKKVVKVHGVPSAWFQKLIIDHVDTDSLLEQAPDAD